MKKLLVTAFAGLTLVGCESTGGGSAPTTTPAYSPPVSDLVGAKAAGGETEMMSRGFVSARTKGLTSYWWHAPSVTCVATVTGDGRYQSVTTVAASDCGY
ncbi:MAG: hypothetical protein NTV73_12755 [Hyphomicrobiales bacterium]|nr:hypothetical protein [Hyphomicrobiales bacterium]